jgi:hypothetical protein
MLKYKILIKLYVMSCGMICCMCVYSDLTSVSSFLYKAFRWVHLLFLNVCKNVEEETNIIQYR